ncbi:RNA polymerase sigma factor [Agriterribacter sp.]|uniref:RNA polymerase sigma factor n=1 Tax=Agriterribacter sp. TaxID=2821509 RepID=UPI002C99BB1F|nr:RNA polymerase sigma factor [Agriterribacter sp.]HTN09276.1 RNA polymerase sigma factor [Agriterribacter sp.]
MEQLLYLVRGCAANDAKCQKIFYEKYLGFALKTVYRYLSSYEAAAEVTNDAFVKIFRAFGKFEYARAANIESLLMAWIRRIVINTAIDHIRVNQAQRKYQPISEDAWYDPEAEVRSDDQLLYKEIIELVRKLSPAYRAVFNMYVIDGYSHQEIGKILGISVGTSKSNLARARAFLQKYLVKDNKDNVLCFT